MIHHFIDDFARNGRYTGFPALGIEWQKLESPTLQRALGMKPGQKGVLVRCGVCAFPFLCLAPFHINFRVFLISMTLGCQRRRRRRYTVASELIWWGPTFSML